MPDYIELLRDDLLEQFKEKEVIDALMVAIGTQLNDFRAFCEALVNERTVLMAVGKQLDGVGDIVKLTREEAGALACAVESVYVLNDDDYREYLIYKIWKNTNNCTYADVMKAFRMFWDKPLHYKENPDEPATMIFETDALTPEDDVSKLLKAPFIKAGGVGIKVIAITETPEMTDELPITGLMGRGYMITTVPEIPVEQEMLDVVQTASTNQNIMQTTLPNIEEE